MNFFSSSLIVFNLSLICSQYIRSQNEKFQNSLMCALHCGHFTFALRHGKSLVPGFFEVSINCLFDNSVSEKEKLLFWKKSRRKRLEFQLHPESVRSKMAASSKIHKCYVFVIFAFLTEIRDSLSFTLIYCLLALSYQLQ